MEKNRLYIVIASVTAYIGIFWPWGNVSLGTFGGLNISGVQGDGWIIAILAGGVVALVTLKDRTKALAKSNATGVAVLGVLQTIISVYSMFTIGRISMDFGYGFGVSLGFGLIVNLLAGIATVVLGLMALSGGKISKATLTDAAEVSKEFAQTVGRITSATVKSAVNEVKKETEKKKESASTVSSKDAEQLEENEVEPKKVDEVESVETPTEVSTEETPEMSSSNKVDTDEK